MIAFVKKSTMFLASRSIKLFAFIVATTVTKVVGDDLNVYIDTTLASGWENWSWSSTIDFAATDIISGSSGTSISVTSDAWSALSLYNPTSFKTYAGLKFDIAVSHQYIERFPLIYLQGFDLGGPTGCYSFDSVRCRFR